MISDLGIKNTGEPSTYVLLSFTFYYFEEKLSISCLQD